MTKKSFLADVTFRVLEGSKVGDTQLTFPDIKNTPLQESNLWMHETKLFPIESSTTLTELQGIHYRDLSNVSINPKQKYTRHFKVSGIK